MNVNITKHSILALWIDNNCLNIISIIYAIKSSCHNIQSDSYRFMFIPEQVLRNYGFMEHVPEGDSFRNLMKDSRDEWKDKADDMRDKLKDRLEDKKVEWRDRKDEIQNEWKDKLDDKKTEFKDRTVQMKAKVKDSIDSKKDTVQEKISQKAGNKS